MNGKLSKDSGNILVDINFIPENREKLEQLKTFKLMIFWFSKSEIAFEPLIASYNERNH